MSQPDPPVRIVRTHQLKTTYAEGAVWQEEPGMWGGVAHQCGVKARRADVFFCDDESTAVDECRKAVVAIHREVADDLAAGKKEGP